MKYEYLNETDIKAILLDQVRQVETMLFQHNLFVPSKLENNNNAYIEWQNKKTVIERSLKAIKKAINEQGFKKEDLLELLEKK